MQLLIIYEYFLGSVYIIWSLFATLFLWNLKKFPLLTWTAVALDIKLTLGCNQKQTIWLKIAFGIANVFISCPKKKTHPLPSAGSRVALTDLILSLVPNLNLKWET